MKRKAIWLLERTKDSESHIIGFYSTRENAIAAIRRYVNDVITDDVGATEEDAAVVGVYISEGFLMTRNSVEVDEDVEFKKIEDPDEFNIGADVAADYHPAEDLGDVDLNQQGEF